MDTRKPDSASATRRTKETRWSVFWTAVGTSSSSEPDVLSMNPRNTRSNPARVADASKTAVITSWWCMPQRLHRRRSSVHQTNSCLASWKERKPKMQCVEHPRGQPGWNVVEEVGVEPQEDGAQVGGAGFRSRQCLSYSS